MWPGGYGYPSTSFEQTYRCYSASFVDKPQLESGDRIIMPASALDRLASLHIDYPMLFELHNPVTQRTSHCGVLEFTAEEGMVYMPYWMMENMVLRDGDILKVKNATLPKGTYIKLQPHTNDFLHMYNPRAVLETSLRNFTCLTTGDTIMVAYNNKKYDIDISEVKPASAITIIDTDCEVDFATPHYYKEPERAPAKPAPSASTTVSQEESNDVAEPKFSSFTGVGRRLDGLLASSGSSETTSHLTNNKTLGPSSSSDASQRRQSAKLVFGSGRDNIPADASVSSEATVKEDKHEVPKEEPKFQAFTGKKYSLKD